MGKISDALRKVMEEREKQNREAKTLITSTINKEDSGFSSDDISPISLKSSRRSTQKFLPVKDKAYIAKTRDDSGMDSKVVVYYDYPPPISEQYKILRTNIKSYLNKTVNIDKINMNKTVTPPRMITITSSLRGEGKTVTCANLAVALARDCENKILIVDCDLRGGTLHKLFNLDCRPGLSDILTTDFDWSVALHTTKLENLFVLPRGETIPNSSDLFSSKRMKLIIEKLKSEQFSYIILDTPPLLFFTDASVLGVQTQGIILVVQARRTPLQVVKKAEEFIKQSSNRLIGFIFTQVDYYASNYYYNYYYYRDRGSNYQKGKY
ncbi:MAG: hypothetical protein B6D56_01595 [Candidatus Omnitrophica bacterium 4484_70.1]|nr:MAG: hypothetical protein B6D56_01595 [Candidatus Omnitrophica bacterium 4484_70.1]